MSAPGLLRLAAVCAPFVAAASAQPSGLEAREIVRRALAHDAENWKRARNYTFLERIEERQAGPGGALKEASSRTYDVTLLAGSPYRRLVARDDRPLPPGEERKEAEKLERSIRDRRAESQSARERRIAAWERRRERDRALFAEIASAFDFTLDGERAVGPQTLYVISAIPHPGYQARDSRARMFAKFRGKLWIDTREMRWVRVEADTTDTISFGWFLARLAKGMHFEIEQEKINNEVWLTRSILFGGEARLGLLKKIAGRTVITYSNFRKFQADSSMVSSGEPAARP